MKSLLAGTALSIVLLTGSLGLAALPVPLATPNADPVASPGHALAAVPLGPEALPLGAPIDQGAPSFGLTAAGPVWNPAGAIHPGIMTFTGPNQCTANFVWFDAADIYIGQAAHCAGTGAATDTNGCIAGFLPVGTDVDLGTGNPGRLVYSSWALMQSLDTPSTAPECLGNDFALVKVNEADEGNVNPAVPFFGGPTGIAPTAGLGIGDMVYSFGNSGLRFGLEPVLAWKHGTVLLSDSWSATIYTATPGIPGDSGSGFMDASGRAIGVLSTVAVLPFPLSNDISSVQSALAYRSSHGGAAVTLGTAPWVGGIA